jgi:hypothetical protein
MKKSYEVNQAGARLGFLLLCAGVGLCQSALVPRGPPRVAQIAFTLPVRVCGSSIYHRLKTSLALAGNNDPISEADEDDTDTERDTVRVRIWKALAPGDELSLKQLGAAVGERKDLKSHLKHVAKQSETIKSKSTDWRRRRGLPLDDSPKVNKLRLKTRRGKKNELYVRLE